MTSEWPTAELDPVRRLHVPAAGIPGAFASEATVSADPARLWDELSDLEAADKSGRALHSDGSPIDGLNAIRNLASNVLGRSYPGAGATIGHIAATHAAS